MINTIDEGKYYIVFFDEATKFIEFRWLSGTQLMTDQEYKQALLNFQSTVLQYKPTGIITDLKDLDFTITPALQHWVVEEILKKGYLAFKKLAIIISDDLFTQISTEQALEDYKNAPFEVKYFTHERDAFDWLSN